MTISSPFPLLSFAIFPWISIFSPPYHRFENSTSDNPNSRRASLFRTEMGSGKWFIVFCTSNSPEARSSASTVQLSWFSSQFSHHGIFVLTRSLRLLFIEFMVHGYSKNSSTTNALITISCDRREEKPSCLFFLPFLVCNSFWARGGTGVENLIAEHPTTWQTPTCMCHQNFPKRWLFHVFAQHGKNSAGLRLET